MVALSEFNIKSADEDSLQMQITCQYFQRVHRHRLGTWANIVAKFTSSWLSKNNQTLTGEGCPEQLCSLFRCVRRYWAIMSATHWLFVMMS
jgi:hypothetical protein